MEDGLTARTSLIHSGKNIFHSEIRRALVDLDLQLPGHCGPYSVWKLIAVRTEGNLSDFLKLYLQNICSCISVLPNSVSFRHEVVLLVSTCFFSENLHSHLLLEVSNVIQ